MKTKKKTTKKKVKTKKVPKKGGVSKSAHDKKRKEPETFFDEEEKAKKLEEIISIKEDEVFLDGLDRWLEKSKALKQTPKEERLASGAAQGELHVNLGGYPSTGFILEATKPALDLNLNRCDCTEDQGCLDNQPGKPVIAQPTPTLWRKIKAFFGYKY